MTLSIPRNKTRFGKHAGFTLVEMLVVIGIIILLIGILMPAINLAYTHSVRNRMMLDIQSISTALEAYKGDQRSYPTLDYSDTAIMGAAYPGSVLLCRALIAPGSLTQDGNAGPGFTNLPNGQVYGPYLEPSRFKLVSDPILGTDPNNLFIADRYQHPILYFKANPAANPAAANGYVNYSPAGNPQTMYNLADDSGSSANPALVWSGESSNTNAITRMRLMLGDTNANGMIDGTETAFTKQPYLLWGAGPDEVFGVDLSVSTARGATYVGSNDDATNFRQ